MENLPLYVSIVFVLTTMLTVFIFYKAAHNSKMVLIILSAWLIPQGIISFTDFYTKTDSIPPRFALLVFPPVLFIILFFTTTKGRKFIDSLDVRILTILHVVRIPVEVVLLWLFLYKVIPQLMTFEGRNFDILSGLTAPVIYYFGYVKKQIGKTALLFWNILCLGLLFNIVINAVLSAPFPFQQFAFDQPNIAVLYFPFVWLPCCVVPLVLFSHLATIRQLLK
ncbi:hypothetical protein [Solitalea koreensis]|uniref:Uncharacterized protein n=1 Tax=Solitalea koreensis TaxID=543615 RepID=A0A521D0W1_9SPHI|nr:hypothetical protein [Solitalea koreensis]SMO65333.1 hypothetical protein SAMN06265350_105109 [Solitalea koreensis]